jgi:3-carboxy-cis,cis-muconate cycloisomerase
MAEAVSDLAWLGAMLEVEAALADAEASLGLVPAQAAAAIRAACVPARFNLDELGREAVAAANPVLPLVRALRRAVPEEVAGHVHLGATSQDVLDTAMMLVSKQALGLLLAELEGVAAACAGLAQQHRVTPMAGRTLLQLAVPISFGLKAAGWLQGTLAAADRLDELLRSRLAVQLGGAAGTLASFEGSGLSVTARLASSLGLAEAGLPWHSERTRVAELGAALAIAAGAAGKIALDILLLSQTEVGEVAVADPGGSSAMPHKRNPAAAIEADACARGAVAQASVLLGSLRVEHERAAGAWQAEWPALSETFRLAAGAVAGARSALEGLVIDTERMAANLSLGGGLVMAEAAVRALAAKLGRTAAEDLVRAASKRVAGGDGTLAEVLAADPAVGAVLSAEELAGALDPARQLGQSAELVDRALADYRKRRRSE